MTRVFTVNDFDVATVIMTFHAVSDIIADGEVSEDILDELRFIQPKLGALVERIDESPSYCNVMYVKEKPITQASTAK